MKATAFCAPNHPLKAEEGKEPEISLHEFLARIEDCRICHGDVQRLDGQIKVRTPIVFWPGACRSCGEGGSRSWFLTQET